MEKQLTCIICPRGCALTAQIDGDNVAVTGNACPKGQEYAANECINPVRTVTATVRVANRHNTMVSVKTAQPVKKAQMMAVMEALRQTVVQAPLAIGQVVLQNVCQTDIIVTKAVD